MAVMGQSDQAGLNSTPLGGRQSRRQGGYNARRLLCLVIPVVVASSLLTSAGFSSLTASPSAAASQGVVHLSGPLAIAAEGGHLWVTDGVNSLVAELNATDGSLVRDRSAQADGLNGPFSIAISGTNVWVANQSGSSVTELNASNGFLVRVIK